MTRPKLPEVLPIRRPHCPQCHRRMTPIDVSSGPDGFERRTFRCRTCDHTEVDILACDPLRSSAVGWTDGELKPPT
jgi:tRNA(Ile2) C34 agmatinyltransferase TiaS